jgi:hypothetical protein
MEHRNLKFPASAFLDSMQAIKDQKELAELKSEKQVRDAVESFRTRAIAELEDSKIITYNSVNYEWYKEWNKNVDRQIERLKNLK